MGGGGGGFREGCVWGGGDGVKRALYGMESGGGLGGPLGWEGVEWGVR